MRTRSLLVSFPGYPFDLKRLLPDRELASMAGSLVDAGHFTRIADYGTPDMMARLFPEKERKTGASLARRLFEDELHNPVRTLHLLWRMRSADRAYQAQLAHVRAGIGEKLASRRGVDFAVFKIADPDDYASAVDLAQRIKAAKQRVKTIAIGRFVDHFAEAIAAATDAFDCLCTGEIEATMVLLAERIHDRESWRQIPNLIYRENGGIVRTHRQHIEDLGTLPMPAYLHDNYPALATGRKLRLFELEDSRGCGARCRGCSRGREGWTGGSRLRPARAVVDEAIRLEALYGARVFLIGGPATPLAHVAAVAHELRSCGTPLIYGRTSHAAFPDPFLGAFDASGHAETVFTKLRGSGCVSLAFRTGSGSQRLLDTHFGYDAGISHIERVIREAKAEAIATTMALTYPCPDDDFHTRAETLRLISRALPDAAPVRLPEPEPMSEWDADGETHGYVRRNRGLFAASLNCRTQFPLPRGRWQSTPHTHGNRTPSQIIAEQEELIRDIEGHGVAGACNEELPLIARLVNGRHPLPEFARDVARHFITGDISAIADLIMHFNGKACVPARFATPYPADSLRKVVGN